MNKCVTAAAEVTISLTLTQLGSWGEECQVSQIIRQATAAAQSLALKSLAAGTKCNVTVGRVTIEEVRK